MQQLQRLEADGHLHYERIIRNTDNRRGYVIHVGDQKIIILGKDAQAWIYGFKAGIVSSQSPEYQPHESDTRNVDG